MKLIDKADVVAKIDSLQDATMDENRNFLSSYHAGIFDGLSEVETFIDSLEVKEVDIEKEAGFKLGLRTKNNLIMENNEKLEEAKKLYASANADQKYVLESLFPELAELKDETLRKNLIKAFNTVGGRHWGGLEVRKILTWLEKQDDNTYSWKPTEEQYEALDYAYNSCPDTERGNYYEGVLETLIEDLHKLSEKQGEKPQGKTALEAIKEEKVDNQNYIKPADNTEPKFHEGEWIVFKGLTLYVEEVVRGFYRTISIGGIYSSYGWNIDNSARLWTLQDARDGNVLYAKDRYCYFKEYLFVFSSLTEDNVISTNFCYDVFHGTFDKKLTRFGREEDFIVTPATKKRRELLFQKMKEAGYEWGAEKKEPKKIEQSKLTEFEDAVKDMMNTYRDAIGDCDATAEEVKKHAAYMLSLIPLKPTVEWKPSEEQMDALESAVSSLQSNTLETLYQDLKREKNHE